MCVLCINNVLIFVLSAFLSSLFPTRKHVKTTESYSLIHLAANTIIIIKWEKLIKSTMKSLNNHLSNTSAPHLQCKSSSISNNIQCSLIMLHNLSSCYLIADQKISSVNAIKRKLFNDSVWIAFDIGQLPGIHFIAVIKIIARKLDYPSNFMCRQWWFQIFAFLSLSLSFDPIFSVAWN